MADRNAAFADLLFSSGLRLTEAASLLTLEVPRVGADARRYHAGRLASLKRLREDDKERIRQLKADNEALIGPLHLAKLQNEELRQQLAESAGKVHTIGRR